jgi:hypothetical protein
MNIASRYSRILRSNASTTRKAMFFNMNISNRQMDHVVYDTNSVFLRSSANEDNNDSFIQKSKNTDFEYQEMKIILDVLQREKIVSSNRMDIDKANELNRYISRIVSDRSSNVILSTTDQLCNTSWTMMYTTMNILPPDTTIQLKFGIDTAIQSLQQQQQQMMQYRLLFGSKTFGLNAINVNSQWSFGPSSDSRIKHNNSNNNLKGITLMYDTISMDAFGLQNIHLCFISNLFQGRINSINTVYYDGTIWIEKQEQLYNDDNNSNADPKSNMMWNVYRKVDDESCI